MANYTWNNAGNGNLSLAANWINLTTNQNPAGTPPGTGDSVTFANGSTTLTGALSIGSAVVSSETATLRGALTTTGLGIGLSGAAGPGGVIVDGRGSVLDVVHDGTGIGSGGSGSLVVSGGATVRSATADSNVHSALSSGSSASGTAAITVTGAGSSLTASGSMYIGRAGTASLVVDQGGSVTGGSAPVGDGLGANAGFSVTIGSGASGSGTNLLFGGNGSAKVINGSTLHSLRNLNVGSDGSSGTMLVDGQSLAYADGEVNVGVGGDRVGGNGTMTIQGGSIVRAGLPPSGVAAIAIGAGPGNHGTVLVTGTGSMLEADEGPLSVGTSLVNGSAVSGPGSGTLTISQGGVVRAGAGASARAFTVGRVVGETGTVTVTDAGSQLVANGLAALGGSATLVGGAASVSDLNGGLFRASGLLMYSTAALNVDGRSTAVIGSSAGRAGALTVDAGASVTGAGLINAAVVNDGSILAQAGPQGGTLTLSGPVTGAGTLTIGSFGSLSLGSTTTEAITFADGTGQLGLAAPGGTLANVAGINGFRVGDTIAIKDGSAAVTTAAWSQSSAAGGTLSLSSNGTQLGRLNLSGDLSGYVFNVVRTGSGSDIISLGNRSAGGGLANTTIPDGGSMTAPSGSGNAYIFSGGGSITLDPASSNNFVVLGSGAATVNDQGGNAIFGGSGGGTVNGGTGSEIVVAKGGALVVNGGTGGGAYWGQGTGSSIHAGTGSQAILVGAGGDKLYSAGGAGDLFGVTGPGDVLMDGSSSSGDDVFFGASGTGTLTFICGSGNDMLGLGQGINLVTLGSGQETVFANTGTTGISVITAGSGSADIGLGGASVQLELDAVASGARVFDLYNYVPGATKVMLHGYGADEIANAIAGQTVQSGSAVLVLGDNTRLAMIGVTKVDAGLFG